MKRIAALFLALGMVLTAGCAEKRKITAAIQTAGSQARYFFKEASRLTRTLFPFLTATDYSWHGHAGP